MSLLDELHPQLAASMQLHCASIIEERREAYFDNALVLLACANFQIRVVRDRGTILIDLRPDGGGQWHRLEHILEFLTGSCPTDLVREFDARFIEINSLMLSDLDGRDYTAFQKKKADAAVKRFTR